MVGLRTVLWHAPPDTIFYPSHYQFACGAFRIGSLGSVSNLLLGKHHRNTTGIDNTAEIGNRVCIVGTISFKLKAVEHYVDYLKKHARSARPNSVNMPIDGSFPIIEGNKEEVLEKLREIPASHRVIVIRFENAESYCTYAPVVRRIASQLPTIVRRLMRRDELLCARLLFAFTADLPVTFPKLKAPARAQQREAARKLAGMGGTMLDLGEIPRRRAKKK
jgi:hypothetical protein